MEEAYRVLKQDRLAVMYYGWNRVDEFFSAWREASFLPVGHLVFRKDYASRSRLFAISMNKHTCWRKADPLPAKPLSDVIDVDYSGNRLHPTQKPISALVPLIRSLTLPGGKVLDHFAGSGSTCAAATLTGRKYIGIEMDEKYVEVEARLKRVYQRIASRGGPLVL